MTIHVKIELKSDEMCCRVCSRAQFDKYNVPFKEAHVKKCDLGVVGAVDSGYCALFIPSEYRIKIKKEILDMWQSHSQRWIRENHVKIDHKWNDMCCRICTRALFDKRNVPFKEMHVKKCSRGVEGAVDWGYCALFIPKEDRVKTKKELLNMWTSHSQRWIREKSDFN